MNAGDLRTGDIFVNRSREEWNGMKPSDRKKEARVKVIALGPECKHDRTRVHLRTTAGDWCIPFVAPVLDAAELIQASVAA